MVSCGTGLRHSSDPVWLWPTAVALIRPLAWELLYGTGAALKSKKKKKKTNKKKKLPMILYNFWDSILRKS